MGIYRLMQQRQAICVSRRGMRSVVVSPLMKGRDRQADAPRQPFR